METNCVDLPKLFANVLPLSIVKIKSGTALYFIKIMKKATFIRNICDELLLHDIMQIKHIVMQTLEFESLNEFQRIIKTECNALQLWTSVMDNFDEDLMKNAREIALLSDNRWDNACLAMETVKIAHWNKKRDMVPTGFGNLKN